MLASSGGVTTGATSSIVRDNHAKHLVLVSHNKGKVPTSPLSIRSFQSIVTSVAATMADYNLTPNKATISDANGTISTSTISNIEHGIFHKYK